MVSGGRCRVVQWASPGCGAQGYSGWGRSSVRCRNASRLRSDFARETRHWNSLRIAV